MAKIYEADYSLRTFWYKPSGKYEEARDLLRGAGVPDERISLFFSRPQLLPVSRFYPTLEEAIAQQEAELAAWRPEQKEAAHVAIFRTWNDMAPNLMEPVSDHVFWNSPSNHYQVDLKFNINSQGSVSAVEVLDVEPADREIRSRVRKAVDKMRFRPFMEDNRRRGLRDVHMRVLVPGSRTEEITAE